MQKHSEAKNWLKLRMALLPLVPSPHSLKRGWILYTSNQKSVCLPNRSYHNTVCTLKAPKDRTRFCFLQWGILEMPLLSSGGNSYVVFHFRNLQKPFQVRWVPWGNAVVMGMLPRICLCKYLFLWFMMCLVFPGYMKSNYNLKCVLIKKIFFPKLR